jgi:hypothetical protein
VTPVLDASQDARLLSAARAPNGSVSFSLRRALRPCDAAGGSDVPLRPGGSVYVIWAAGPWPLGYHGAARGSKLLQLAPPSEAEAAAAVAATAATGKAAPFTNNAGARAGGDKGRGGGASVSMRAQPAGGAAGGSGGGGANTSPVPARAAEPVRRRALAQAGATPGADAAAAAAATAAAAAARDGRAVINITLPALTVPAKTTTYLVRYLQLPSDRWAPGRGGGGGEEHLLGAAAGRGAALHSRPEASADSPAAAHPPPPLPPKVGPALRRALQLAPRPPRHRVPVRARRGGQGAEAHAGRQGPG